MITTGEISQLAKKHKVRDLTIEKDYVITWMLYGISQNNVLREALAFKGGTVLKKVYFEFYRFSEDLDFTLLTENLSNEQVLDEFQKVLDFVMDESAGINLQINLDKNKEHKPTGSLKFIIDFVAPMGGAMGNKNLKVDVTRGETLEFELKDRPVLCEYRDIEDEFKIQCYTLGEVLIEKMTAVMGRTIPRDIYDLWYLFVYEGMDLADHHIEFESKARNKGHDPADFRTKLDDSLSKYENAWQKSLGSQIHELPDFKQVIRELNQYLRKFY